MKAFGLSDMMNAKGLIRQVLEGGVANPKSLANTLNDPRYKALATAFNFSANGANTTSSTAVQQTTASNCIEQTLETNVGQQNQGTQEALYFQRMAAIGMRGRELTDELISDFDEGVLEASVKACAAHLSDLRRVHVKPPEMIHPPSYPRFQAHPGPAPFPAREVLATVSSPR